MMQAETGSPLEIDELALPRTEPTADPKPAPRLRGGYRGALKRAGVILLVASPYVAALSQGWTVCPMAGLSGQPCPGCGLTRATLAALHGDLGGAFELHPLFPMLAPLYVYFLGSVIVDYVLGSRARPPSPRVDRIVSALAIAAIVAVLVVWMARFFGAFGGPAPVESWFEFTR